MSNRNSIIQRVASLVSNRIEGDTIHLIDSYLDSTVQKVCQMIALNKPLGHEFLLTTETFDESGMQLVQGLPEMRSFQEDEIDPRFVIQDRFHAFEVSIGSDTGNRASNRRIYPVGAFDSLSLADSHDSIYYYIENRNVYISAPASMDLWDNTPSFKLTHYAYQTITGFPEVLEYLLIDELVKLIPMEANRKERDEVRK